MRRIEVSPAAKVMSAATTIARERRRPTHLVVEGSLDPRAADPVQQDHLVRRAPCSATSRSRGVPARARRCKRAGRAAESAHPGRARRSRPLRASRRAAHPVTTARGPAREYCSRMRCSTSASVTVCGHVAVHATYAASAVREPARGRPGLAGLVWSGPARSAPLPEEREDPTACMPGACPERGRDDQRSWRACGESPSSDTPGLSEAVPDDAGVSLDGKPAGGATRG